MLCELDVRNLGIIETVHLTLGGGLTVLTGETGAGKSLLVQSLQLLAGARAEAEQVRGGCDRLVVEGRFRTPSAPTARRLLEELGVDVGDELILRREVSSGGRSRAWVNDVAVTAGALQRLAPSLLAIDGQHEQRGLADPATHLAVVDAAGGLEGLRGQVSEAFAAWQEVRERLVEQRAALASRRDRLDVIAYQTREIEDARLQVGEDIARREERSLLRHGSRIAELVGVALHALGGDGGSAALARAARVTRELSELGVGLGQTSEELSQAQILAEEAVRSLEALADRVRVDPGRLEVVEARLATIERLSHKYGGSLEAVLAHLERLAEERRRLEAVEDDLAHLEQAEQTLRATYLERANELSAARREAGLVLCREAVRVLARLGMSRVELRLALCRRESPNGSLQVGDARVEPGPDGVDIGEFLISPNPGEEVRPMARIASGGELSRLHLAIRTVLRQQRDEGDHLTLLYDEIDSGIGGRVADELGVLLAEQGRRHQVLVVTHLPQLAVRAATHLMISKATEGGRTTTHVVEVSGESREEEVVRMMGGGANAAARAHARALLGRT
ncbi:MAG: DNA repair protein RecN [Thermoanaerobaculaceae bacterium]|nr:DNA repair protein RecN [Thermoanaerobaculaceae bacterium]MDI9623086.1 DNA repair protein RecN [Acidobacteriota bacterium]NLH11377.1 DNA repair protein RecN [Holophagae bacterium]HPW55401.1 DNA repair protein RecN [Thermoanaerobaculaceae bacterium]